MTTTSRAGLATGRWAVDAEHSTATFQAGSLGRTVTGTVPVVEGTVDIGRDGLPSAIAGSPDLGAIHTGTRTGTPISASPNPSISTTIRP
jgi:polyisoprenoid-binding protein YceI